MLPLPQAGHWALGRPMLRGSPLFVPVNQQTVYGSDLSAGLAVGKESIFPGVLEPELNGAVFH